MYRPHCINRPCIASHVQINARETSIILLYIILSYIIFIEVLRLITFFLPAYWPEGCTFASSKKWMQWVWPCLTERTCAYMAGMALHNYLCRPVKQRKGLSLLILLECSPFPLGTFPVESDGKITVYIFITLTSQALAERGGNAAAVCEGHPISLIVDISPSCRPPVWSLHRESRNL